MKVFFAKVKEKRGVIHPAWFMSYLAPQFYTAFVEVNGCCPKKLACTWRALDNVDGYVQDALADSAVTT